MKIAYIAPYNTVGTLNLWKKAHNDRGNECIFITLCQTNEQYNPGICLNLPLIKPHFLYIQGRHLYYKLVRSKEGNYRHHTGFPPTWHPNSIIEKYYFDLRDWLWSFKVEPMIEKLGWEENIAKGLISSLIKKQIIFPDDDGINKRPIFFFTMTVNDSDERMPEHQKEEINTVEKMEKFLTEREVA